MVLEQDSISHSGIDVSIEAGSHDNTSIDLNDDDDNKNIGSVEGESQPSSKKKKKRLSFRRGNSLNKDFKSSSNSLQSATDTRRTSTTIITRSSDKALSRSDSKSSRLASSLRLKKPSLLRKNSFVSPKKSNQESLDLAINFLQGDHKGEIPVKAIRTALTLALAKAKADSELSRVVSGAIELLKTYPDDATLTLKDVRGIVEGRPEVLQTLIPLMMASSGYGKNPLVTNLATFAGKRFSTIENFFTGNSATAGTTDSSDDDTFFAGVIHSGVYYAALLVVFASICFCVSILLMFQALAQYLHIYMTEPVALCAASATGIVLSFLCWRLGLVLSAAKTVAASPTSNTLKVTPLLPPIAEAGVSSDNDNDLRSVRKLARNVSFSSITFMYIEIKSGTWIKCSTVLNGTTLELQSKDESNNYNESFEIGNATVLPKSYENAPFPFCFDIIMNKECTIKCSVDSIQRFQKSIERLTVATSFGETRHLKRQNRVINLDISSPSSSLNQSARDTVAATKSCIQEAAAASHPKVCEAKAVASNLFTEYKTRAQESSEKYRPILESKTKETATALEKSVSQLKQANLRKKLENAILGKVSNEAPGGDKSEGKSTDVAVKVVEDTDISLLLQSLRSSVLQNEAPSAAVTQGMVGQGKFALESLLSELNTTMTTDLKLCSGENSEKLQRAAKEELVRKLQEKLKGTALSDLDVNKILS